MLPRLNSLTVPSKGELEVVKGAILEAVGDRTLSVGPLEEGIPASVVYIHALIARGLGDFYDYQRGVFKVNVTPADVKHHPSLGKVSIVQLEYAPGEGV